MTTSDIEPERTTAKRVIETGFWVVDGCKIEGYGSLCMRKLITSGELEILAWRTGMCLANEYR